MTVVCQATSLVLRHHRSHGTSSQITPVLLYTLRWPETYNCTSWPLCLLSMSTTSPELSTLSAFHVHRFTRVVYSFCCSSRRRSCLSLLTQRSLPSLASREAREKLRKPCGRSSSSTRSTDLPRERSRRVNMTESSSNGSRWQACNQSIRSLVCNAQSTTQVISLSGRL